MNRKPISSDLFTMGDEPQLIAGCHFSSREVVFPKPKSADYESFLLPRSGTLWSFTVQRFAPKSPPYRGPAAPFAVGYIELGDDIIVESRLIDVAFEELKIGMVMETATEALFVDAEGTEVHAFAFRPKREI